MANNKEIIANDIPKNIHELLEIIKKLKNNIDIISSWLHSNFDVLPQYIKEIISSCDALCAENVLDTYTQLRTVVENTVKCENVVSSPINTCDSTAESDFGTSNNKTSFENEKNNSSIEEDFDIKVKDEYLSDDNRDCDSVGGLSPCCSVTENDNVNIYKRPESTDEANIIVDSKSNLLNLTKTLVILLHDINKCNPEILVRQLRSSVKGGTSNDSPSNCNSKESASAVVSSGNSTSQLSKMSSRRKMRHYCNTCGICQKRFLKEESLQNHIKLSHNKSKPFHCHYSMCKRAFRTRAAFSQHMRVNHADYYAVVKERPFHKPKNKISVDYKDCENFSTAEELGNPTSKFCRRKWERRIRAKSRKRTNKGKTAGSDTVHPNNLEKDQEDKIIEEIKEKDVNAFVCQKCKTECPTRELLNEHLFNYCYKCKICRKPFSLKCSRDEHLVECENENTNISISESMPLSCELCQTHYDVEQDLRDHMEEEHSVKTFLCAHIGCKRKYTIEEEVIEHEKMPHCLTCHRSLSHVANFLVHNDKTHAGQAQFSTDPKTTDRKSVTEFQCSKCRLLFTSLFSFKSHLAKKCFVCQLCGRILTTMQTLKMHIKAVHSKEKPFLCPTCGKTFIKNYDLIRHTSSVHVADRKTFKCPSCDKTFMSTVGYSRHMKIHDAGGSQRKQCTICGFDFATIASLKQHIKAVHEKQRPYPCHLCDKRFKSSTSRKYHIKTHDNPNSRKRGLNKDVDDLVAAAKRRGKPSK